MPGVLLLSYSTNHTLMGTIIFDIRLLSGINNKVTDQSLLELTNSKFLLKVCDSVIGSPGNFSFFYL